MAQEDNLKLSSIALARTLAFVEVADLDLKGRVFFPALVGEIVNRYQFQVTPKLLSEQQETARSFEFRIGKAGDVIIDAFKMFDTLLVVETHSNTRDSQVIIEEMLDWAVKKHGLTYQPEMIRHWSYVSSITFYTDVPLLGAASNPLASLSDKINGAISEIWKEDIPYVPGAIAIGHDPLLRKNGIAPFTLSHRAEIPYSENKYFSEAPLPTDTHIKLLEEFEADVLAATPHVMARRVETHRPGRRIRQEELPE
jgi:hypothetical protein